MGACLARLDRCGAGALSAGRGGAQDPQSLLDLASSACRSSQSQRSLLLSSTTQESRWQALLRGQRVVLLVPFRADGRALVWGAISCKVWGAPCSGFLGPVIGWPVSMSMTVVSASGYGYLTGEWRQSSARPIRFQLAGIAILCAAVVVFSRAHS
jgi:hypothetical protein